VSRITVGIVDYGVGNLASVRHALREMGYRSRVAESREALAATDMLLLPGVGAFPPAMAALHGKGLAEFVRAQAFEGKPVVGICLGMQLLADSSTESRLTAGLGLVPGTVQALEHGDWHIGWNSIEVVGHDPMFAVGDGREVYFNHSYVFSPPAEYTAAVARVDEGGRTITAAVRRNNVVGLQFHPEKSQAAGRQLLASVIDGLTHA
jgi:imidazole glycerol phosphate synthase glutamine amidotransferase subunit